MGMPTIVGVGAAADGTGAITPGFPASYSAVAGDIALTFLECDNVDTITIPSGWALVAQVGVGSGTTTKLTCTWRRLQVGDTAPQYADAGNHQIGRMIVIRGCVASGDPWDWRPTNQELIADTSVSMPGGTTTVDNCLILAAFSTGQDIASTAGATGWSSGELANLTEQMDNWTSAGTGAGGGGGFAMATGEKALAGLVNATSATLSLTANFKALMTIALKGEPPPPTVQPIRLPPHLLYQLAADRQHIHMAHADRVLQRVALLSGVTAPGTAAFITQTFTPPDNSLLTVAATFMETAGASDPTADMTISGGGLTYTSRVAVGTASSPSMATQIWTAPVGTGAPMALTLDCGARNGDFYAVSVVAYLGYDTASPVGATATGVDTATPDGPNAITLSGAPADGSEVFAALGLDMEFAGTTQGSGWTEVHQLHQGLVGGQQTQARDGSTSTSVDWADTSTGGGSIFKYVAAAIEIKKLTVAPGDALVTPAAIAVSVSLPQVAVSVGAAPAALSAVASLPTPTAAEFTTVTPAAINAVATLPQVTVSVAAAPAALAAPASLPKPNVAVMAAPAVTSALATLPQPAVGVGTAPAAVAAVATIPRPDISVAAVPALLSALATLPKPLVGVGAAPAALLALVTLPTPTIPGGTDATATPAAVQVLASLPQPTVGAQALPSALAVVASLPQVSIAARVFPVALAVAVTLPSPTTHVGAGPAAISVTAALPTPVIHTGVVVAVISVVATLPTPLIVIQAPYEPILVSLESVGSAGGLDSVGTAGVLDATGRTISGMLG